MREPSELLYSSSDLWVEERDNGVVVIGMTQQAADELGEAVYIDYPSEEENAVCGEIIGSVESDGEMFDIYSPVTGEILRVNTELMKNPKKINENPFESWLIAFDNIYDKDDLMTEEEYEDFRSRI